MRAALAAIAVEEVRRVHLHAGTVRLHVHHDAGLVALKPRRARVLAAGVQDEVGVIRDACRTDTTGHAEVVLGALDGSDLSRGHDVGSRNGVALGIDLEEVVHHGPGRMAVEVVVSVMDDVGERGLARRDVYPHLERGADELVRHEHVERPREALVSRRAREGEGHVPVVHVRDLELATGPRVGTGVVVVLAVVGGQLVRDAIEREAGARRAVGHATDDRAEILRVVEVGRGVLVAERHVDLLAIAAWHLERDERCARGDEPRLEDVVIEDDASHTWPPTVCGLVRV